MYLRHDETWSNTLFLIWLIHVTDTLARIWQVSQFASSSPNEFSHCLTLTLLFSNAINSIQSHQNAQKFFLFWFVSNWADSEKKRRDEFLKSGDRWNTVQGNLPNCHVVTNVPEAWCHAFTNSIFSYRIGFHFEYFILHLNYWIK